MNTADVVITSFYTNTWHYADHARRLAAECDRLGLEHHIVERRDAGGYLANCRQKPVHIAETLEALGRPLLWVDVDGSVLRVPTDLPDGVDFAAVPMAGIRTRTWHVGTLYFRPTRAAKELLALWVGALGHESDEAALDVAWKSGRWHGTHAALPTTYMCYGRWADVADPVVMHRGSHSKAKRIYQAARG